jgi:predicted HicB family RNase H-like nuclease
MLKTETLNLRISAEFKRRLIEEARKEKRSVTNYIEAAITQIWSQKDPNTVRTKIKKGV